MSFSPYFPQNALRKQNYHFWVSVVESFQTVIYETYDILCARVHWKFQKLWAAYMFTITLQPLIKKIVLEFTIKNTFQ